jgi:hypothetical protein
MKNIVGLTEIINIPHNIPYTIPVQMGYCNFVSMFRDEKWEGLPDRYETH